VLQTGRATGIAAALSSVVRDGGARALLRGAGMRVAWIAPQVRSPSLTRHLLDQTERWRWEQGCVYYPVYELAQRTY
jgi:hypothetical protein